MSDIWTPQPRQIAFMERPEYEVLYGGAAGGGKSDALLIEALRQVHIPHYKGIIFRKTYPQLTELIDRSRVLYRQICPAAKYNGSSHVWSFPSGAQIYFGNMQRTADRINYQGKAYDLVCFDELTHFQWEEYSYMFSRNRPTGPGTRVYMRATTNPGGIGHAWVKARFIDPAPPMTTLWEQNKAPDGKGGIKVVSRDRIFVPATIFDNQALLTNDPNYLASLSMLDENSRQALLMGDWNSFEGQVFREWKNDPEHYDDHIGTHVINPFRVPREWRVERCFDFGYTRPSACLWVAISPENIKYVIREYYTCTGTPNQGTKIHHVEMAEQIKEIEETDENLKGRKIIGVADPAIFDESRGMSIAADMAKAPNYIVWHRGDHKRLPGKMQMHYHLAFDDNNLPMLQVFNTCRHTIRTIPTLVYDETNVEDINSDGEDHTCTTHSDIYLWIIQYLHVAKLLRSLTVNCYLILLIRGRIKTAKYHLSIYKG